MHPAHERNTLPDWPCVYAPLRSEGQRQETAAFLAPLLEVDCFEGVQVGKACALRLPACCKPVLVGKPWIAPPTHHMQLPLK